MTKKRFVIAGLLILAILITAAAAQKVVSAQADGHMGIGMMGPMGGRMGMLARHLDLTYQQKQTIHGIMAGEKTKIAPLMVQMADAHKQIEAATDAGTLDQAQALNIIESHKEAFAQLLVEKAKTQTQIMGVLTPDQQAKLKEMKARHQERMQKFMNHPQGNE
jgi:Spy/CpxP family protein refolding chaperone